MLPKLSSNAKIEDGNWILMGSFYFILLNDSISLSLPPFFYW